MSGVNVAALLVAPVADAVMVAAEVAAPEYESAIVCDPLVSVTDEPDDPPSIESVTALLLLDTVTLRENDPVIRLPCVSSTWNPEIGLFEIAVPAWPLG